MNKPRAESNWKEVVLAVREAAESKGVTQDQISDRTGLIQSNISRIFNLKHPPLISTLASIAEVVGKRIVIEDIEK